VGINKQACIAVREHASPLWKLACHMRSDIVTCLSAEVPHSRLYPASYLILWPWRDARLSWRSWLGYMMIYSPEDIVSHPSTNRAQHRVTLFMWRMTLPLHQTATEHTQVISWSSHLHPLSSDRQHMSYDVCLEVRGEIIRTILFCTVYWSIVHSHKHT